MTDMLLALVADRRSNPADERGRLAADIARQQPPGSVLLTTCHRTELYGPSSMLAPLAEANPTVRCLAGRDAARHVVSLAIGRESAVVGEDQVLHQLRGAVQHARLQGHLAPDLDRLLDLALHAGRRARSWLPARRPSLADVAVRLLLDEHAGPRDQGKVLVVGAGRMGRLAALRLAAQGVEVVVTSRSRERAAALAEQVRAGVAEFDPGPAVISGAAGLVIALGGPWPVSDPTLAALLAAQTRVVDLSAPPALPESTRSRLGSRLVTIDEVDDDLGASVSDQLAARLDALVEQTVAEYEEWRVGEGGRATAEALAQRASAVRARELERLWRRAPDLTPEQRREIERTIQQVADRLLREPLESAAQGDTRSALALRELFRL